MDAIYHNHKIDFPMSLVLKKRGPYKDFLNITFDPKDSHFTIFYRNIKNKIVGGLFKMTLSVDNRLI